jgi:protein-L-isoaspartate(D-aspartate) O-methyltransferase
MKFLVLTFAAIIVLISGCVTKEYEPKIEDPFVNLREKMVKNDLKRRDITDMRVLTAMQKIPRHEFVPSELRNKAYEDRPLPIGYGQTISQPYVVALMTQSLNLKGGEKVLEIGTGSGYQAAVLAELVDEVYTMEIIPELANRANETLHRLEYKNVRVKVADGYFGWEENAPYDAIMITAAVNHIPTPLVKQLKGGGRLILPLGSTKYWQTLTLVTKYNNSLETKYITSVRFVPMTGEAMKNGK